MTDSPDRSETAADSNTGSASRRCPLCDAGQVIAFRSIHGRAYFDCDRCQLIHLAPEARPGREEELAEYGQHRNSRDDPRYRAFLGRLASPLVERLPRGAEGLDFGSGPAPTLSVMLEEQGFPMAIYDPFFAPDRSALARSYDFITCTETAEHFFEPGTEFARLARLLRPGGWLGVMTEAYTGDPPFEAWRYARERSHVSFYRTETMRWLAARHRWVLVTPRENVFLFRSQPGNPDLDPSAPAGERNDSAPAL